MKIFYIIGKSASGKDHIFAALKGDAKLNLSELILYTTRPMRAGEIDGETYHFVDESRLIELRREGRVIEERTYDTVYGPWTYATVDEDIDLQKGSYIAIGTLESFVKLRDYYGTDRVVPLYIEVSDENLLLRAMKREKKQDVPKYKEMCRRFLTDSEDFSEEKILEAGIDRRFDNNGELSDCIADIRKFILSEDAKAAFDKKGSRSGSCTVRLLRNSVRNGIE